MTHAEFHTLLALRLAALHDACVAGGMIPLVALIGCQDESGSIIDVHAAPCMTPDQVVRLLASAAAAGKEEGMKT